MGSQGCLSNGASFEGSPPILDVDREFDAFTLGFGNELLSIFSERDLKLFEGQPGGGLSTLFFGSEEFLEGVVPFGDLTGFFHRGMGTGRGGFEDFGRDRGNDGSIVIILGGG